MNEGKPCPRTVQSVQAHERADAREDAHELHHDREGKEEPERQEGVGVEPKVQHARGAFATGWHDEERAADGEEERGDEGDVDEGVREELRGERRGE